MLFNSRGFKDAAAVKGDDLEQSLVAASQGGKIPIVCDTSPCLSQIKGSLSDSRLKCVTLPIIRLTPIIAYLPMKPDGHARICTVLRDTFDHSLFTREP